MFARLIISIIAAGFALSLNICQAGSVVHDECSDHRNLIFLNEVKNINNLTHGVVKRLFFIHIFNGLWPVPDRYQVYSYGKDGISLQSPYDIRNILNSNCPEKIVGYITFGQYDKSEHSIDDKLLPHDSVTMEHDGLFTIEIHRVSFRERTLGYVLIHDDTQYIKIVDENQNLWRAMLSTFETINLHQIR